MVGLCVILLAGVLAKTRRNVSAGLNVPVRIGDDFVFTVTSVTRTPLGDEASDRVRYVVSLRIANQASRRSFDFHPDAVSLVDAQGREHHISPQAQREHEAATGDPTARPLPAGSTVLKDLVFEVPADVRGPRMKLRGGADDALMTFLHGQKRFVLP